MRFDFSGISKDIVERFGTPRIIGLGSGSTIAEFVKVLSKECKGWRVNALCIPTSLQIERIMQRFNITVGPPSLIPKVQLVIDGADQVDRNMVMIKGGGGALLKEKILHKATQKLVIMIGEEKLVSVINHAIPVEVHPFAETLVKKELVKMGGRPRVRMLDKGYPYMTENANMILDTKFSGLKEPAELEKKVKSIPGVIEVGIFTRRPDAVYVLKGDGAFDVLE